MVKLISPFNEFLQSEKKRKLYLTEKIFFMTTIADKKIIVTLIHDLIKIILLNAPRKKCSNTDFFLARIFPYLEYGDLLRKTLYSVQIRENKDQKNSIFGYFSHSGGFFSFGLALISSGINKRNRKCSPKETITYKLGGSSKMTCKFFSVKDI